MRRRASPVSSSSRRRLSLAVLCGVAALTISAQAPPSFSVVEATIAAMRQAMEQGRTTSRELVQQSLTRIALYEDRLNAVIAVNRRALEEADARDRERAAGKIRGALHGIPIALKDNIHTTDMPTTGGALAFAELVPPYEATVARNLREAGAIIIAKTQMTELANWVTVGMPANYNSLTGYGMNPYDPRRDPRWMMADGRPALTTGGSSSGVGTAASFWVANVGTETSGSILSPANQNMLVGIKPTVGRVSRYGIIPIASDRDTAGPMARSVADAATLLGAMEGASRDPNDAATPACSPPPGHDYTRFLDAGALKGARIGIPRAFFYDRVASPGTGETQGGLDADQRQAMNEAIATLVAQGAVVIDPADIPSVLDTDPARNFLAWDICAGLEGAKGKDGGCSVVLKYGMKRDFNAWLASLGPTAPVKTLTELRRWNLDHESAGTLKYGQENLDISDEMDVEMDRPRYEADLRKDLFLSATHGIDEAVRTHRLDALLFAGLMGAAIAARPGYPTVMVPFAMVPNAPSPPFPEGFDARQAPLGVSFSGAACSEPRLIALAYAFEQATRRRVAPALFP
ncbi:MAG: amidase [Acidobacteria bacterium]|nr:amidase [Acidobacteriota bacterium]